jgi:hypothetical protein
MHRPHKATKLLFRIRSVCPRYDSTRCCSSLESSSWCSEEKTRPRPSHSPTLSLGSRDFAKELGSWQHGIRAGSPSRPDPFKKKRSIISAVGVVLQGPPGGEPIGVQCDEPSVFGDPDWSGDEEFMSLSTSERPTRSMGGSACTPSPSG